MKKLNIKEIFYSLQGEGLNTGRAAIFIRLSGCNLKCSYCDTDFKNGIPMSVEEIEKVIDEYPGHFIIWTGGEPTLQLTDEITAYFKNAGYEQAIETNGTRTVPTGIDYITCSPKPEAIPFLKSNFPNGVDEFRFPVGSRGTLPPDIGVLPPARAYMVSPIFSGNKNMEIDREAVERCLQFIMENPEWRLSVQLHKLLDFQ